MHVAGVDPFEIYLRVITAAKLAGNFRQTKLFHSQNFRMNLIFITHVPYALHLV